MQSNRKTGLDLLKIIATLMVVILHLDGYSLSFHGEETFSFSVLIGYFSLEGIAYPAVLLFVLAGSWFMIDHVNPIRQISYIWCQTWLVAVIGLIGYILFIHNIPDIIGGVSCLLHFLGRAYWFVTEYIILIILAPYLNRLIDMHDTKELLFITVICGCIISIFPTLLPFFPWNQDNSNIGQFILLYFIAASIKRMQENNNGGIVHRKWIWFLTWILNTIILILSATVIHIIRPEHELYFYRYNSPFVILEAVALFIIFVNIDIKSRFIRKTIEWVQRSSLVVYMIHMHPLFKVKYDEWRLLQYINVRLLRVYVVQIVLTAFIVFAIGTIGGWVICKVAKIFGKALENRIGIWKNSKICVQENGSNEDMFSGKTVI